MPTFKALRRLKIKHLRTRPYTRPKPTARQSASSRPACANGPTPGRTLKNAPPNCPSGCTALSEQMLGVRSAC
jgi:hypothetical protein